MGGYLKEALEGDFGISKSKPVAISVGGLDAASSPSVYENVSLVPHIFAQSAGNIISVLSKVLHLSFIHEKYPAGGTETLVIGYNFKIGLQKREVRCLAGRPR